jgi:hypothetical protein
MWESLRRLVGLSGGLDPKRDKYDPVYGLAQRAVDEWLARNPAIRDQYDDTLRTRAVGRGLTHRPRRIGAHRLRPEPVEQRGGEIRGQQEPAHVRDCP